MHPSIVINKGRWGLPIGLLLLLALLAAWAPKVASQEPDWPTPPPAPPLPLPHVAPASDIVHVAPPTVPGASAALILPLAPGPVPRIPPLRATSFETGDGVRLVSQAGTLEETVQLVYEPMPADTVAPGGPYLRLLQAFELRAHDHRGQETTPRLLRPWVLEVPIPTTPEGRAEPERLLLARWDDGGWMPLVTNYHRNRQLLVARILRPGRYAVLQDSLVALS